MWVATSDLQRLQRRSGSNRRPKARWLPSLMLLFAFLALHPVVGVAAAARAMGAVPARRGEASPTIHDGKRGGEASGSGESSRQRRMERKRAGADDEKQMALRPKDGVDAEAMAEASAPDRQPRRVASNHAYEAFLMAQRAMDEGDVGAARHWLRQVLAFDAEAGEARRLLQDLDAKIHPKKPKEPLPHVAIDRAR